MWEDSFVSWVDDFGDADELEIDDGIFTVKSQIGYTYHPNTKKQWKIESKSGQNFNLKFNWFDIQSSGDPDCEFHCSCQFDKVKIIVDDDESNQDFWCPSAFQSSYIFFYPSVQFQPFRIEF